MRRTISRTLALLMMLMLIMTSPAAAFADAESIQPDGTGSESAAELNDDSDGQLPDAEGTAGGQDAEAAENDGQNDADTDTGQDVETGEEQTDTEPAGTLRADGGNEGEPSEYLYSVVYKDGYTGKTLAEYSDLKTDDETPVPEDPSRTGYAFQGWEPVITTTLDTDRADENRVITYTAIWSQLFTVTFKDGTGKTLKTEQVPSGDSATAPAAPTRSGYHFDGWDKDFSSITKALIVNATWNQNHSYGAWKYKVKPTYFKTGSKIRKCSCGKTETKKAPKLKGNSKWVKDNGKWYYFDKNGKLFKGWHKMKPRKGGAKKWIYFTTAGVYKKKISKNTKKKWIKIAGKGFYFTKNKKPAGPGFNYINGTLYYMDKYGAVKIGTFKASDGRTYTTAKNGAISGIDFYKAKYGTFIFIDISEQRLRFYQNGKLKLSTDIVSGHRGVSDTPRGTYHVTGKSRNIYLVGRGYRSFVNYWISFIGSEYGMHDASWRTSAQFSNHSTYIHNGSHGCVNMKYGAVQQLYGMVSVGTTVIIQN